MNTQTRPTVSRSAWAADSYLPNVRESGAQVLATSGIAPLVAAARGYVTLEAPDVPEFAKQNSIGVSISRPYRQLNGAAVRGDTTVIPWYSADLVGVAHGEGRTPYYSSIQIRPSAPVTTSAGKLLSFEFVQGNESVLDANPGTPKEWLLRSPRILVTEGILNGDAALTALLRANGIDDVALEVPEETTRADAIRSLHSLMMQIPASERVTILSLDHVRHGKGSHAWEAWSLAGREVLLAVEGDVDNGRSVWKYTNGLWTFAEGAGATVKLVSFQPDLDHELDALLSVPMPGANQGPMVKYGLADYLASGETWHNLLDRGRDEMPVPPLRNRSEVKVGTWRVTDDGNAVEVLASVLYADASRANEWQTAFNIGGRIIAVETHRGPTLQEVRTAHFGAGMDETDEGARSTCRIELQWLNQDGETERAVVTGPAALLMYPPQEWDKRNASIPNAVLMHPEWPPAGKWLSAIKDNTDVPVQHVVSWATMGYVPAENSNICSFISGRTVLAFNDADRGKTIAGVTENVLPGASSFSLPPTHGVVDSDEWRDQVRNDLRSLREHYVDLAPWTDVNVAAVVMAAGLRPAVPIDCTTVIYFQGPPGNGKSWTVSQILSFHQKIGTWTAKKLPGSMKDTATGVEQAIAQSNVWVMDDLAPSPDKRLYALELAKIGDIIRAVFNKSSKRRSGVDLKAREVFVPHALLLVTAENPHTINSVRDRTVIVNLGQSSLRSDDARQRMDRFRDDNRAPGRLMAAGVQAFQHLASVSTWTEMIDSIDRSPSAGLDDNRAGDEVTQSYRASYFRLATTIMATVKIEGKSDARHVEMAVDLMLGFVPLTILAGLVGDAGMLRLLDPENLDSLPARVARMVSTSFQSQSEQSPGLAVLEALKDTLAGGYAHIENFTDASKPPFPIGNTIENRALGWRTDGDGKAHPLGSAIGFLHHPRGGDLNAVLLNARNSFDVAQKYHPTVIPAGSSAVTTFKSLWNEKLIHPRYLEAGQKEGRHDVLIKRNGRNIRKVPVHLDQLLGTLVADEAWDHDGSAPA
ncbi:hypothetical protein [Cryobacterium sp. Y62]|uniref:hypothetical protein n=1 Tax=Cryobacterium sp. Y62 TaxID=2048284 RepID=UPI0011B08886|nr:hypothetical protein [Cryobacterium sp. Y62]